VASNNKIGSSSNNAPDFLKHANEQIPQSHRKLLVVQLSGGNDGLNTIVPFNQEAYYKNRPNINIAKNDLLLLNDEYGFNKSLSGFRDLCFSSFLTIINNVGYPNPTRSHFKSLDIWKTASDSNNLLSSGWLGRYLDATCEKTDQFKLKAVEIGDILSLALKGEKYKGVSFENIEELINELNSKDIKRFSNHYKKNQPLANSDLDYIYQTIYNGQKAVKNVHFGYKKIDLSSMFPKSELGKDLKTVAEIMLSDEDTQVFYVSHGTFDTHVSQRGKHEKLLRALGNSLKAFVDVMIKHQKFNEVCILVFSEFGRRVQENGSAGTDHGAGNNLFIISPHLSNPGVYNPLSDLQVLVNGDIGFEIDFRQIYASILEDWLLTDSAPILNNQFEKLPIFKNLELIV